MYFNISFRSKSFKIRPGCSHLVFCLTIVRLCLQGTDYAAQVQSSGLIKDSKGKVHLVPEYWLKSILGNNIPVSATYAWDKVRWHTELQHQLSNCLWVTQTLASCHVLKMYVLPKLIRKMALRQSHCICPNSL